MAIPYQQIALARFLLVAQLHLPSLCTESPSGAWTRVSLAGMPLVPHLAIVRQPAARSKRLRGFEHPRSPSWVDDIKESDKVSESLASKEYQRTFTAVGMLLSARRLSTVQIYLAATLDLRIDSTKAFKNVAFRFGETLRWSVLHAGLVCAKMPAKQNPRFYFCSYTMTSVGYGDLGPKNVVERTVCTMMILTAGLCWAYVLGDLSAGSM